MKAYGSTVYELGTKCPCCRKSRKAEWHGRARNDNRVETEAQVNEYEDCVYDCYDEGWEGWECYGDELCDCRQCAPVHEGEGPLRVPFLELVRIT
jgi:hypothetical protein